MLWWLNKIALHTGILRINLILVGKIKLAMEKIIKSFILTFLGLTLFINTGSAQTSQNEPFYYVLEFEVLDQKEVKPLIGVLMPLFKEVPHLEKEVYNVLYYQSFDAINQSMLELQLEGQSFEVVRFKEISPAEYLSIVQN